MFDSSAVKFAARVEIGEATGFNPPGQKLARRWPTWAHIVLLVFAFLNVAANIAQLINWSI